MATFTAGQTLTASALNLIADRPMAHLVQTVAQSIASDAAITFDSETVDTHGGHDNVTNNTRYTFPITGKYLIAGKVAWAATASAGYRQAYWQLNGSSFIFYSALTVTGSNNVLEVPAATMTISVTASEYISLRGNQNTGGALSTSVSGFLDGSTMTIQYLGL